jgi:hypothetical protein
MQNATNLVKALLIKTASHLWKDLLWAVCWKILKSQERNDRHLCMQNKGKAEYIKTFWIS